MSASPAEFPSARLALRICARRPGWTLALATTLALGIAAVGFTVGLMDATLWRPLPFPEGDRLFTMVRWQRASDRYQALSFPAFERRRGRLQGEASAAAFSRVWATMATGRWPQRIQGEVVSGEYFDALRARPAHGRLIGAADESEHARVVVVSDATWRSLLGGDPGWVGRPLLLNDVPFTVIGVAEPGFEGPAWSSGFWVPVTSAQILLPGDYDLLAAEGATWLQTIGRLAPGTGLARVQAEAAAVDAAEDRAVAGDDAASFETRVLAGRQLRLWPGYRGVVGRYLAALSALSLALLLACVANVTTLLGVRHLERRSEIALRRALGATSAQIAGLLVAESLVPAIIGGVLGVMLVVLAAPAAGAIPLPVPWKLVLESSPRMLAVAVLVALLPALVLAALAAIAAVRGGAEATRPDQGSRATGNARHRGWLVGAQLAVSVAVLAVAVLLARSLAQAAAFDTGLDLEGLVTARLYLEPRDHSPAGAAQLRADLAAGLRREGFERVAFAAQGPLSPIRLSREVRVAGSEAPLVARYGAVSAGALPALGIALLQGRAIDVSDAAASAPVALVSRALAARWPERSLLGESVRLQYEETPRTIVGIVDDVRDEVGSGAPPWVYVPFEQDPLPELTILLRRGRAGRDSAGDLEPNAVVESLRRVAAELDPRLAITDPLSGAQILAGVTAQPRALSALSLLLAAVILTLALVGLHGLLAWLLGAGRRELAIRQALGASPSALRKVLARRGVVVCVPAVAIGLALGAAAQGAFAQTVPGLAGADLPSLLAAAALVLGATAAIHLRPVLRAGAGDPSTLLRQE